MNISTWKSGLNKSSKIKTNTSGLNNSWETFGAHNFWLCLEFNKFQNKFVHHQCCSTFVSHWEFLFFLCLHLNFEASNVNFPSPHKWDLIERLEKWILGFPFKIFAYNPNWPFKMDYSTCENYSVYIQIQLNYL